MSKTSDLEKSAEALAKKVKRKPSATKAADAFDASGRRVIQHDHGKLPEIVDAAGSALAEYGGNLFVYAGRLVCLHPAPKSARQGVSRARGALILHQVDSAHLTELLGRAAQHERYDARSEGYKPCDPPRRVADTYLSRGHYPEQRNLTAFIEAPTVTPGARLLDQPGYDPDTELFLAFDSIPGYTAPPTKPTKDDAVKAAARLLEAVSEFPFVDDSDRAAFLAGVMTGLLRRLMPAAPMIGVTSSTAGTGKTLIADTFAIVSTGRRASVLSLGHDDAETEKRLGGVLLAGDLCITIDNIEKPLKGDLLCQALTQESLRLRPLGGSGMISVPTQALIVATGNNLAIVGDLKRRALLVRMDAGVERPELRAFKQDHLAHIFTHRGELIRDALTICLSYLCARAPAVPDLRPLGGFELWDRMVRRPLVWLGMPDPLKAAECLREQDPDLEAMRQLFGSWHEVFSNEAKTGADVVAVGMQSGPITGTASEDELRDALQLVCSEKPNARRLGYWLRAHKDRIVDGLTLKQAGADGHAKVARWRVENAGDAVKSLEVKIPF